ncbi:MAG: alpha/beta fold hydrolase [bacterium]
MKPRESQKVGRAVPRAPGSGIEKPITFKVGGEQIVGMLHVPAKRKGKCPAVVCFHGLTGSKTESHRLFVKAARMLAETGMVCLRIDFRGSGDSEGDFSQMTIGREIEDAREALKFLRARPEVDTKRIGILGMSMGGMVSAYVLGSDKQIRTSVLWAPVGNPRRLVAGRLNERTLTQLATMGIADVDGWAVGQAFVDEMLGLDPLKAVIRVKGPVLIIHGDNDESVPANETKAYVDALKRAGKKVQYHLVHGADHTFNSLAWETETLAMTFDWFRTMLR